MLSKILITLMLAYPIVAYIVLWLKQPQIIIAYLILIFFLLAIEKCWNKHWYSGLTLLLFVGLIAYFMQQSYVQYLLYFPPILILSGLFILFSQSLLSGQTPLITRYAHILGDNLKEQHLRYNRSLTVAWSVFFLLMALTSILLAIFSTIDTWSLFTHVISYLLIGSFFVIEFIYRKRHFAGEIEDSFFQFIRKIIKIRPHNLSK